MANLNRVFLIGRLTRDPEQRSLQSGNSVTNFGLAVNRTYTRRDSGEKVEETCFVDCEAWGRQAETIARYTSKGRQLFVEGRLKFDSWERDGQRQSKLRVVVENFQFLDSNAGGGGGGGGGDYGRQPVSTSGGQRGGYQGGGGGGGGGGQPPMDDDIPF
ncbi:MAG: single-stranded DNA-binding protein [Planctomycetota bacterium]|nr:single-stranded DNA-binding protein [Planctomycetota bacterium]